MSFSRQEYSELIKFFAEPSASQHILSLSLSPDQQNHSSKSLSTPSSSLSFEDVNSMDEALFLEWNNVSSNQLLNASIRHNHTSILNIINTTSGPVVNRISPDTPVWLIPCYSIILLFAIVGNLLVISTLVQNRRMRTVTNLFLLNLAISDILLGVLCMPVTLVGTLLKNFIFGEVLCKLIPFSQGK